MDIFSPKKGKPVPKLKAKVAPMAAAAHAAEATPVYPLPAGFQYANNNARNMYRHGFKANRPMSNANKAALATRRRAMIRAARNYGGAAGAASAATAAAATAAAAAADTAATHRPALQIPNNNNAGGSNGGARKTRRRRTNRRA